MAREKTKFVSFRLSETEIAKLNEYCISNHIGKSEAIRLSLIEKKVI